MVEIDEVKNISIKEYLEARGISFNKSNMCSSPFSSDSNPSFRYYPHTNTFYDFSSGDGGDIIKLVMLMESKDFRSALEHLAAGDYTPLRSLPKEPVKREFSIDKYRCTDRKLMKEINRYAANRKISSGYLCGSFPEKHGDVWVNIPCVMFAHYDSNLQLSGVKLRRIKNLDGFPRFSARGSLGMYILENILPNAYNTTVYIVEGESSANSLMEYLKSKSLSCVVISFGAVSAKIPKLPEKYADFKRKLIIDYDGSEELFTERIKRYEDTKAKPIKLILPKGEDINSLYVQGKIYLITNLII